MDVTHSGLCLDGRLPPPLFLHYDTDCTYKTDVPYAFRQSFASMSDGGTTARADDVSLPVGYGLQLLQPLFQRGH